jgi:phage terminase small subunit
MFIDQYFICGLNGTEAAKRAGYSVETARQMASENLSKPYIRAEIDRRMAAAHMSADEIISRLEQQAAGTMDDFIYPSGRGMKIDLTRAKKAGKLHLVKKYSKSKQGVSVELYSQKEALELLGRHKKLFTDNIDLTSQGEKLQPDDRFNTAISTLADALRESVPGEGNKTDGSLDPAK